MTIFKCCLGNYWKISVSDTYWDCYTLKDCVPVTDWDCFEIKKNCTGYVLWLLCIERFWTGYVLRLFWDWKNFRSGYVLRLIWDCSAPVMWWYSNRDKNVKGNGSFQFLSEQVTEISLVRNQTDDIPKSFGIFFNNCLK